MHYRCGMRTILVAALLVGGCKRHAPPMAELASKCTGGDFGCPVPILYVHDLATIKAEPKNQPWGLREMQVVDIDGNVLRIGSPIDHD
jgi:hypothetical protein